MTKQRKTLPPLTLTSVCPIAGTEGSSSSSIPAFPRRRFCSPPGRHAAPLNPGNCIYCRAKEKYKIKEVSLGERSDQWNCCLCGAAAWSCGISMNSPLWFSRKNQHCHVTKIKLFRCEFPIPLRHKTPLTATSEHILFFFSPQNCGRKTVYWSLLRNQMLL